VDRPVCSAVVVTDNGRALLETCLGSIARRRPQAPEIEVVVLEDASTDDTAA
jgi:glycosyltransferase involved in cell wall biosynthesis